MFRRLLHILQDTGHPTPKNGLVLNAVVLRLRNPVWPWRVFGGPVVNWRAPALSRGRSSKVPADVGMWEPSMQEENQTKD